MAMPHNAVIIGAGAIAAEFASMWNAAGCKVTMLIRKDRVLSGWDRRAGVTLTRELKRHGIDVIDRSTVTHIDTGVNMGALVHYTSAKDGRLHRAHRRRRIRARRDRAGSADLRRLDT